MLAYKLLFWTERPLSLGAVTLSVLMSAALAQLASGDGKGDGNTLLEKSTQQLASVFADVCNDSAPGGPVSFACGLARALVS